MRIKEVKNKSPTNSVWGSLHFDFSAKQLELLDCDDVGYCKRLRGGFDLSENLNNLNNSPTFVSRSSEIFISLEAQSNYVSPYFFFQETQ
jgi:hypothetical protein